MGLNEKQKKAAYNTAFKDVIHLNKIIKQILDCMDKMPLESPEYGLFVTVLDSLVSARGDLLIIESRCK